MTTKGAVAVQLQAAVFLATTGFQWSVFFLPRLLYFRYSVDSEPLS